MLKIERQQRRVLHSLFKHLKLFHKYIEQNNLDLARSELDLINKRFETIGGIGVANNRNKSRRKYKHDIPRRSRPFLARKDIRCSES